MTIGMMLDTLLLGPLKLLFETIFSLVNRVSSPGISIVALSLAINFLVLPLYRRADVIQAESIAMEKKLRPGLDHIRRTFQGDERFMMQQTYYRQNRYSPLSPLKGALPLLLEIPFFIAAYQFLSGLSLLSGASFGPIRDLGSPDALLQFGGLSVNLLPVLMTVINLMSSAIYTRGAPLRSKIQLYGMAAIFLVLLYGSPAGLTLYWTLNNLFSLLKNMFTRTDKSRMALRMLSFLAGVLALAGGVLLGPSGKWKLAGCAAGLLLMIPMALYLLKKKGKLPAERPLSIPVRPAVFFLSGTLMAVLTGLFIPSSILAESPSEFIDSMLVNPSWFVVSAFLYSLGTFVVWMGIYYLLGSEKMKKALQLGMWIWAGLHVVNYMVLKPDRGNLSSLLQYDIAPVLTPRQIWLNLAILAAVALVLAIILLKAEHLALVLCCAGVLALGGMGIRNVLISQDTIQETLTLFRESRGERPSIPLSRSGKNVVMLMIDRAIGSYPAAIFEEKPELKEKFDGFTWYANTLSHGGHSIYGTPGLYGGYDYTPWQMNQEKNRPIREKHNDALLVMPTLFSRENYTVTVSTPPFAGKYKWQSDLSLYDGIPDCHVSDAGLWVSLGISAEDQQALWLRNYFCYGLSEAAPLALYGTLYNMGLYNQVGAIHAGQMQVQKSMSVAEGGDWKFMNEYYIMSHLNDLTVIREDDRNTMTQFESMITHREVLLQEPEYIPSDHVDNTAFDAAHADRFTTRMFTFRMDEIAQMQHYHINMVTYLLLADWFDFLREEGVYDNTRIILVADHGNNLHQMPSMILPEGEDIMHYAPLLMVKDFNAHGELRTDETFMTNADVPWLMAEGVLENTANPFTGHPLNGAAWKREPQKVITSHNSNPEYFTEMNVFDPSGWYEVKDQIYDPKNWTYLGVQ